MKARFEKKNINFVLIVKLNTNETLTRDQRITRTNQKNKDQIGEINI
jgi:hypothetical protein